MAGTKAVDENVGDVLAWVDWFSLDSPYGRRWVPRFHGYLEECKTVASPKRQEWEEREASER